MSPAHMSARDLEMPSVYYFLEDLSVCLWHQDLDLLPLMSSGKYRTVSEAEADSLVS